MNTEYLNNLRHSTAHLLAAAILKLYPEVKNTIGPAIEDKFYYDFDFGNIKINDEDLTKIEAEMHKIIKTWKGFERHNVSKEEALSEFSNNEYKVELINEISAKGEEISIYQSGEFRDLCRGGHVENPAEEIKFFKLLSIAGAYWRGDEKNKMLVRIYGTAFPTLEELEAYLDLLEEAKKRDHRKIGKELELFYFDEEIGKGLPIWLPKGNIIKEELENWAKQTESAWGYDRVTTPVITKENLFYTSGHLPLYKESMYAPIEIEGENYYLKPMNCPFHHKVFSSKLRSYKELPVRVAEYGLCHRYEDSGSLFGLMRVRGMEMNDAHIYCSYEDAVSEFIQVIKLHEFYYQALGIKDYHMELALRDPKNMDKYHGSEEDWQLAEKMTKEAMEKSGVPYTVVNEGAAFYGPKMDFQIKSATGRMFTASTNQLDLYMPKKFELKYTDKDGSEKTPVVIHRAPLGTHERFIGFLIEQFAGAFPVWMSPTQVMVIPVSDKFEDYSSEVVKSLKMSGVRASIDNRNETLGARVRDAQNNKVPYMAIIGQKEVESGTITLRKRNSKDLVAMPKAEFEALVLNKIKDKSLEL
jgi:threonyl-tRNA synthetase